MFFDWSFECAAMEWEGLHLLGEKKSFHALPGYRCGYHGAALYFAAKRSVECFAQCIRLRKRLASACEDTRGSTGQ